MKPDHCCDARAAIADLKETIEDVGNLREAAVCALSLIKRFLKQPGVQGGECLDVIRDLTAALHIERFDEEHQSRRMVGVGLEG